jgi:hypothetical protein
VGTPAKTLSQQIAEEAGLDPSRWAIADAPPIRPGRAPAPQQSDTDNRYLQGSLPPASQHDTSFVGTEYKGARIPNLGIQPLAPSGQPTVNSGVHNTTYPLIFPVQQQTDQNTKAIAALQQLVFQGAWSATTSYSAGAQADYGGVIYTSLVDGNLGNQPDISPTFWQSSGTNEFLGNWSSLTAYAPGDQVIDVAGGGGYYICTAANTNKQPSTNPSFWQLITPGNVNSYAGAYSGATAYTVGQTVSYQGSQWVCIAGTTGNAPSTSSSFWTLLGSNALFTGTWNSGTAYTQNMIVVYQGNLYQAVQASTNQTPSPSSSTYWQLTGPATLDNLEDGTVYLRGIQYQSQTIVVPNANFEASTSLPIPGWTAHSATLSYETGSPYAGTQSLKVVASAQFGGANANQKWACSPGDQFYVSAAYKSDASGHPTVSFSFYDATNTFISGVGFSVGPTLSWTVGTGSGAAPAGTVYAVLTLQNNATSGAGTVWFDNVSVSRITQLGLTTVDGPQNFSATASTLTYRPTSNPSTATDAGSNATINIASFTMRTSSKGDIFINSGSVTALSYSTLYYVYYDDATLAGGSVTYNATTTKTTAINGAGRFFVGSIVTPAATAPDTTGNNDGGVGAQAGGTTVFLFGSAASSGVSGQGSVTSPTNAIDGNYTTFATVAIGSGGTAASGAQVNLTAASPTSAPWTSLTLYALWEVTANTVNPGSTPAALTYGGAGGGTLDSVGPATTKGKTLVSVSLPVNTNLATMSVTLVVFRNNTFAQVVTAHLYQAWVVGIQ